MNPARSTGQTLFVGHWALGQLWLFWLAPVVGAAVGAGIYRTFVAALVTRAAAVEEPEVARPPKPGAQASAAGGLVVTTVSEAAHESRFSTAAD